MNKLQLAVLEQLGFIGFELGDEVKGESVISTLEDICNHGIDGGFGSFVYYSDTVEFYRTNRDEILELAKDLASDLGEDAITMIKGFNCIKDQYDCMEIAEGLYSEKQGEYLQLQNAMAWFAAEEVARSLVDC